MTLKKKTLTRTVLTAALVTTGLGTTLTVGAATLKPQSLEISAGPVFITSGGGNGAFRAHLAGGSDFKMTLILSGDRRINIY